MTAELSLLLIGSPVAGAVLLAATDGAEAVLAKADAWCHRAGGRLMRAAVALPSRHRAVTDATCCGGNCTTADLARAVARRPR